MSKYKQKTERTHLTILNAFEELIEEKEFEKIRVNDISEKAGITRSTFYNHFDSTYHLLCCSIKNLWTHNNYILPENGRIGFIEQKIRNSYRNLNKNPKLALTAFEMLGKTPYMNYIYDDLLNQTLQMQMLLKPKQLLSCEKEKYLAKSMIDITNCVNINMLNNNILTEDEFCAYFIQIYLSVYANFYEIDNN